jgi:hypothetical protein
MFYLFDVVTFLCCLLTIGSSFVNLSFISIFLQSLIISEKISFQKRMILRYFYLRQFQTNSIKCGKAPTRKRSRLPRLPQLPRSVRSVSCPARSNTTDIITYTSEDEFISNIDNQAIDVDQ